MAISRRQFLGLSAVGAAALALRPSIAAANPEGWQDGPSLPGPAQEVYCTTWNGRIVVAGGLRSGANSARRFTTLEGTALFDPSEGTWTEGPVLPAPRHHIVLGRTDDCVYGFGGFVGETLSAGFQFRDDVYAFDGEQWSRIGAMPTPLGETVALSAGGRIHLVTGSLHPDDGASQGASRTHLVYEPGADAWSEARPVPTARSSATGAVLDGHLYVAAGRRTDDGVTNLGALERYDPETDTWAELRPLPQPSGGLAGAALDGMLYVFGGEYFSDGGGVYERTWAYDPDVDTWTERVPMRTPRHGLAGTALNGQIFAIGGNTAAGIGAATSSVVETLAPSEN
ncbi:MAG: kelch repeat-containing protein [Salinibacter sp.]